MDGYIDISIYIVNISSIKLEISSMYQIFLIY